MDLFQFGQVQITKDKLDVECVESLLEPDRHILNSPLTGMPTPKVRLFNCLVMTCILGPAILIFGNTGCRQRLRVLTPSWKL